MVVMVLEEVCGIFPPSRRQGRVAIDSSLFQSAFHDEELFEETI